MEHRAVRLNSYALRTYVKEGSSVYFVPLETAEKASLETKLQDIRMNFVWNTGRCGSTLMHKLLMNVGVGSFSEPHYLDQLNKISRGEYKQFSATKEMSSRILRACWYLDIVLARRNLYKDTKIFSLNPKGMCDGLIELVTSWDTAFPIKHCFMYRACHQVVESFGSIKGGSITPFGATFPLWVADKMAPYYPVAPTMLSKNKTFECSLKDRAE